MYIQEFIQATIHYKFKWVKGYLKEHMPTQIELVDEIFRL
jgi:hypothetical protein